MKPINLFGSFVYEGQIQTLLAYNQEGLKELFGQIEQLKDQYFLFGFFSYEAYRAFEDRDFLSSFPLAYFGVFSSRRAFIPPVSNDLFVPLSAQWIDRQEYLQKVHLLQEQIQEGNTYQGNLTTTLCCDSSLSSSEIFFSLLQKQSTDYQALLHTPFGDVISFSPELFFSLEKNFILTQPMKGTMPRGKTPQEDQNNQKFLKEDIKNLSENVMITDLLRNDLSKIAQRGSVQVPKLFEIQTYPTLFQMTSTISATLREGVGLEEIFRAIFPCGSISGAPKKSTLEILAQLEGQERGVYCGALGVINQESAIFSIPIRTFFREKTGRLHYGVGSGIVWDSKAEEEYEELKTKMRFFSPQFALFETMRSVGGKIELLPLHLHRLQKSAQELGFLYPQALDLELSTFRLIGEQIVRIELTKEGNYQIKHFPLKPHLSNAIVLKERKGKSDLYAHKSTYRPWAEGVDYEKLFDVIFYDEQGRLLEGSRSNIVLELEGGLYTPCFRGQFLPGIYRQILLQRQEIKEAELWVEDLLRAKTIFCVNSVRGKVEVNLI